MTPFSDNTPVLEKHPDGLWVLMASFVYWLPDKVAVEIPAGFVTNLASIPRLVWPLIPRDGDYAPAAIVHDWLYSTHQILGQEITRAQADEILLLAMADLDIPWYTRYIIYYAVRLGGWIAWNKN